MEATDGRADTGAAGTGAGQATLPRALTPFRTPAYRKLAIALVLTTFTWGVWMVALLSLTGLTRLWHLVVVGLAYGLATSFYYPAYSAWLPRSCPRRTCSRSRSEHCRTP